VPAAGVLSSALLEPAARDPAISFTHPQAAHGGLSSDGLHALPAACDAPCPVSCCRSERRSCWQPSSPKASSQPAFASALALLCCCHRCLVSSVAAARLGTNFLQCLLPPLACPISCVHARLSLLTCTAPQLDLTLCRPPGGAGGGRLAGGQRTCRGALPRSNRSRASSRQPPAALDVRRQPGQGAVGWQLSQRCRGPHGKLPPARPAWAASER
jgi:hypothetical protein